MIFEAGGTEGDPAIGDAGEGGFGRFFVADADASATSPEPEGVSMKFTVELMSRRAAIATIKALVYCGFEER